MWFESNSKTSVCIWNMSRSLAICSWASNLPRSRYSMRTLLSSLSSSSSSISEAISMSTSFRRLNVEKVLSKTCCFKVDLVTIVARIFSRKGVLSI